MTENPWIDTLAWTAAALWALVAALTRRGVGALRPLEEPGDGPQPDEARSSPAWPRVSIVVASRDEEKDVVQAVGSLLELDYPDYEVVAINDRSRDRTGEHLEKLRKRSDRLRVVHITELPEGWIGKHHALCRGVEVSTGEWILFTDGDVRFHPKTLRLAMRRALDRKCDLLSLLPRLDSRSPWMRGFFCASVVGAVLFLGLWAHTRRRQSLVAMGAGAFVLVRRSAYARAGGHEAIRMRMVDDISLAMAVRKAGGRTEIDVAVNWILVPWGQTLRDLFKVTQKNGFAVFEYSYLALFAASTLLFAGNILAPLLFTLDLRLWPQSLVVWLAIAETYRLVSPHTQLSPFYFVLHPIVVAIAILPGFNSAIHVTRHGGVHWRDSFYPLADLRRAR